MHGTGCSGYRRSVGRRAFLHAGVAGLSLPALLRAQAAAETASLPADTAVIQYWLGGAASHIETYDPKPDAPLEFRGPFRPIATNLPGAFICETLPLHARIMDRVTIIRSGRHDNSDHQHGMHWCQTGHDARANGVNPFVGSSHPSVGSVAAKALGPVHSGVPPYVHIGYPLDEVPGRHFPHSAAYLGLSYDPFVVLGKRTGDGKDPGADRDFRVSAFDLDATLTPDTLSDRHLLLGRLDRLRREVDANGAMDALDHYHQAAFDLLTGSRARDAFDLEKESAAVRERYGPSRPGQASLLARRLVEAGVRFVTVVDPAVGLSSSGWDLHTRLEWGMKTACPRMDQAVTALIEDLAERGLARRVLVVVWGEFGRTPRINPEGGRDHWADAQSILLAGGDFRHGQIIGATTPKGEEPAERPIWPYDVAATIYRHLGIDAERTFANAAGRPIAVLAQGSVIRELL